MSQVFFRDRFLCSFTPRSWESRRFFDLVSFRLFDHEGVFPLMALNPQATVARRQVEARPTGPSAWIRVLSTTLLPVALLALAGCEKPPSWNELVGGKKDEAKPAA